MRPSPLESDSMALLDRTSQGIFSILQTKPWKSTRLTQLDAKTLYDLIAHCAIDQDFGRALQRECLSDILLGKRKSMKCYPWSHGALTWSSLLDEYDRALPVNSDKLLRVKPGGGRRAVCRNMQAVNFWDREHPRTDWQPHRCTRSNRHFASDSCTRLCGKV